MRILCVSGLASGLAFGQGAPAAADAAAPPPARAADLDFSDDFPAPSKVPIKRPRSRKVGNGQVAPEPPAAAAPGKSSWYYWALGALSITAVGGGAALYLHWEGEREPAPARNTQVFTDDPG